jgi:hypothetical protein
VRSYFARLADGEKLTNEFLCVAAACVISQDMPVPAFSPTTPLRLALAAEIAFPGGGVTAATLRREGAKGRLAIERIGAKDFTTLAAIDSMRLLCRVNPKESDSGSALPANARAAVTLPSGSSETPDTSSALASALAHVERLRRPSPTTSQANMHRLAVSET